MGIVAVSGVAYTGVGRGGADGTRTADNFFFDNFFFDTFLIYFEAAFFGIFSKAFKFSFPASEYLLLNDLSLLV